MHTLVMEVGRVHRMKTTIILTFMFQYMFLYFHFSFWNNMFCLVPMTLGYFSVFLGH